MTVPRVMAGHNAATRFRKTVSVLARSLDGEADARHVRPPMGTDADRAALDRANRTLGDLMGTQGQRVIQREAGEG